jgi:hypothetical protein
MTSDGHEPEQHGIGPRFYAAMGGYAAIALLAGLTLDGNFRLMVWIVLGGLVVKTYLHAIRKP